MKSVHTAAPSLRSSFAWTFAGNAVNGASQWAILSLIAKLGSTEILGQFALATAVSMPVAMLAHLNLRAVLATDVKALHPFSDYLKVRRWATAAALLIVAAVAVLSGYDRAVVAAIVLSGIALSAESFSDLYYGIMQRHERMDLIARSMILRAAATLAIAAVSVWWFRTVVAAAGAVAAARALSFVLYDLPRARAPHDHPRQPSEILRSALPLGGVLMLIALTTNIPRYAIEAHLGTTELGVYAAVASFGTVGATVVNALGQSSTTRLAAAYASGDLRRFRTLAFRLVALAGALGASGVTVAALAGDFFLGLLYRPEFAEYQSVLTAMLAAASLSWIAVTLGYVTTATRTFNAQAALLLAAAAASAITSFLAVPRMGLYGAVLAVAAAGAVQIAGQIVLLVRAHD